MNAVSLRPAGPDDQAFILDVCRATMAEYHRAARGWDDAEIENAFLRNSGVATQIVCRAGEAVGLLSVLRGPFADVVFRIALIPAVQNQGIGSFLLRAAQARCAREGRPLRLNVYKCNPAAGLYRRLGFEVVGETETEYHMMWRPAGAPDTTATG